MEYTYEFFEKSAQYVREKLDFQPEIGIILGSSLGPFAAQVENPVVIPYEDIPNFLRSTVATHAGKLICGTVSGKKVVCMSGRFHSYEGYDFPQLTAPIRLFKLLGCRAVILTNAAGGIKQGTKPGSLMLLNGQIACFVPSPLIGPNIDELGTRFPDMSQIYDLEFQKIARKAAASLDIDLMEGVYLQLTGPQYESPQEIAMCRTLGADAVGMSTACEAIAARHMGMRVIGISCITNLAAGISPQPLCHAEVQEAADMVAPQFKKLVAATIQGIAKTL